MHVQLPGLLVPQEAYAAGSIDFQPRPPIRFTDCGSMGIRLKRLLELDFRGMPDATAPVILNETGTKIAIRIMVTVLTLLYRDKPADGRHLALSGPDIQRGLSTFMHTITPMRETPLRSQKSRTTSRGWCDCFSM